MLGTTYPVTMSDTDVAIYLPDLTAGGAERVMLTCANGLAERGYDIDLVVGNLKGGFQSDVADAIRIVDMEVPELPYLPSVSTLPAVYRYLSRTEPDMMISSMNHINVMLLLAQKLALTSSNITVVEHNTPRELMRGSLKNKLIYKLATLEYQWADEIVGVSNGVVTDLSEIVGVPTEDIHTIYNPVVTDELRAKANQEPDHEWFDSDNQVVLSVGRLSEQKNQDLLVNAFAKVRETRAVKLILVGQGEREAEIASLAEDHGISEHVEIVNWVDNVYAYMGHADVFVLTSKWEGLPTVLIEALACGCPVVSTDCPSGPREILGDSEYGTLVESYDPDRVTDGIRQQLDDPVPETKLRDRGTDFTVDQCIEQYDKLITANASSRDVFGQ